MNGSNTQRKRVALAVTGVALVALALSGCTNADDLAQARPNETSLDTVPISPLDPATIAPDVSATTTATSSPTTVTEAPTTTLAATTTEAPTTTTPVTEAPTTTTEPPPTTTTLPPNIEIVGAFETPIVPVGTRSGPNTAVLQLRLLQLGFWNGGADGKYGLTTRQAVMAFQKYLALPATGEVDDATAAWITALDTKAHGQSDTGTLVEIDKARQLLFFIVDGKTQWVLNTSTANGEAYTEEDKNTPGEMITGVAITPDGLFKTNRERPEGWWEGDLGQIYRPKYFIGGVAVHGSNSVPNYPASHGCVRLTVQAMDWIWENNMMPLHIPVWVHG
jgi:peptidoglycan hydrolase-like protein with peptidoglycan-binding domain